MTGFLPFAAESTRASAKGLPSRGAIGHRTSTASARSHWTLPGFCEVAAGAAGPQQQVRHRSGPQQQMPVRPGHYRTSTASARLQSALYWTSTAHTVTSTQPQTTLKNTKPTTMATYSSPWHEDTSLTSYGGMFAPRCDAGVCAIAVPAQEMRRGKNNFSQHT